jgi:hypothetical protein
MSSLLQFKDRNKVKPMGMEIKEILLQRHNELKEFGKVTEAVEVSGVTHKTYGRAIKGEKYVRATTMMTILKAQARVLETTKTKLQLL